MSLICCSCTERGKTHPDTAARTVTRPRVATGSVPSGRNREGLSTVAGCVGGPARSSEEASVMEVERRGRVIDGLLVRSTAGREELYE